jgi:hypothetical protein
MSALIIIGLLIAASFAFVSFVVFMRWMLIQFDSYLAQQAIRHRELQLQRYSMTEFRGTKQSSIVDRLLHQQSNEG